LNVVVCLWFVGVKEAGTLFLPMLALIGKAFRESCEAAQSCLMV